MKELLDTLKKLSNKRMELSLIQFEKNDTYYNELLKNIIKSSEDYESLELDEKYRKIIDKLLQDRDAAEIEQASIAYLAGFRDCILILSRLELFDF